MSNENGFEETRGRKSLRGSPMVPSPVTLSQEAYIFLLSLGKGNLSGGARKAARELAALPEYAVHKANVSKYVALAYAELGDDADQQAVIRWANKNFREMESSEDEVWE